MRKLSLDFEQLISNNDEPNKNADEQIEGIEEEERSKE